MESWPSAFFGFASGIAVTLIGALAATFLQRRHERRRRIEEGRFRVYMKFMELYSYYFFVSSAEVRQESVDADLRKRIRSLAGEIADMLRSNDELREIPQLVRILMGMDYPSAAARYRDMGEVLDSLGRSANPRYLTAARALGEDNIRDMAAGGPGRAHTPIFMD
jgi:hypothetical protein